jgi:hypothetical protein
MSNKFYQLLFLDIYQIMYPTDLSRQGYNIYERQNIIIKSQ